MKNFSKTHICRLSLIFILCVSAFYSMDLTAQEVLSFDEQLKWNEDALQNTYFRTDSQEITYSSFYLHFDKAVYPNPDNKLPYYFLKKELSNDIQIDSIYLEDEKYEVVPWTTISNIKFLCDIQKNITLENSIKTDRNTSVLYCNFLPLRLNNNTGYIEKLTSFTLKIKLSENKASKNVIAKSNFKNSSVLATGDWYKIKVNKDGIYKITYKALSDLGITNFDQIQIFGNGEGQLPYNNNVSRIDDLEEIPVLENFGSDGKLNSETDYLLFFANGPNKWNYSESDTTWSYQPHPYSDYYYYFIGVGTGTAKTIEESDKITTSATQEIDQFIDFSSHEGNFYNLFGSGRLWLGEVFRYSNIEYDTTFIFENIITTKPVKLTSHLVSRSNASTSFTILQNDNTLGKVSFSSVNLESSDSDYAKSGTFTTTYTPEGESQNIQFQYNINGDCKGWLDYVTLNAYCNLEVRDNYLDFRNVLGIADNSIIKFNISNASSNLEIWDVSDFHSVKTIEPSINGSSMSFAANGDTISRFIIFNPNDDYLEPEYESEKIENQDIHGNDAVDYIIVALPGLIEQANELADFHKEKSNYNVLVTTPEQIYNEFSSGTRDVSAIRDLARFFYKKYGTEDEHSLKHLLLFGDGTYDNRPLDANTNYIMTYQSSNSLSQTSSFVGDDFFSFLDEDEGDSGGLMDIGIGRFPVITTAQADEMVAKVKLYYSQSTFRPWRNKICFVGDDEDNNLHMNQANQLAEKVNELYPEFAVQKIMLDAYKQVISADGATYPDVTKAIYDALESGVLIMNYVGHGSEDGLAHERIIENQDIQGWQNSPYYSLFLTATCEFSRFDDLETSAGENVLLNPDGGAIALLTTTRIVYANRNFELSKKFYDNVFEITENGERTTFGDILRLSKNAISDNNKRNFTLLGDPACQLNFPLYSIHTDSINDIPAENYTDTVSAFSVVTIKGHIEDNSGNLLNDFNGTVYPLVYDKEQTITTLNNDGDGAFEFNTRPAPIFQGKASVSDGYFNFSFVLPKDIAYNIGTGKIIYYAENDSIDAHGNFDDFYIGGKVKTTITDDEGPEISLYLNDTNFISGGISDDAPSIYAILKDNSGINTSSMGIGHDITIELDGELSELYTANEYFETFQDDYTSGTINYPLSDLSPGKYTATLKAWDINNNSSTASITFEVKAPNEFYIENLQNYPNPFSTGTYFTFEHNLINENLDITILIYSLTGELLHEINENLYTDGYKIPPIYWNGNIQGGHSVGKGLYIYKLIVKKEDGTISENYNRLIIL